VKDAAINRRRRRAACGGEEAVFKHYGLAREPGGGERRLIRR
jgi:hypothetical protein